MSELLEELRGNFGDAEYRDAYAESFVNTYIAAQIKVLREERPLTQGELGEKVGTSQPGIARFENVNYSSWKVETLRKLARALNVWLRISFEEFGTLPSIIEGFNKEALVRLPFDKDPVFSSVCETEPLHLLGSVVSDHDLNVALGKQPQSINDQDLKDYQATTSFAEAAGAGAA